MKIVTGVSKKFFEEDAVFEVLDNVITDDTRLVLYFVSSNFDQDKVVNGVREYMNKIAFRNDIKIVGASTAGEFFNGEFLNDSITAVSFSGDFRVGVGLCDRVSLKGMMAGNELFEKACADAGKSPDSIKAESRYDEKYLGICINNGLSKVEELVMVTLKNAAGNISIAGGSAADSLKFERVYIHVNGLTYIDASVFILLELDTAFEVGYSTNYIPASGRMKITKADYKKRVVDQIDYVSCADLYAGFSGKSVSDLSFYDLLSNPLGVNMDNQFILKSPIRVNSGGSMGFLAMVKEGQEVYRMRQQSMISELDGLLGRLERRLGDIECLILFNCVYRHLEVLRDKTSQEIRNVFDGYKVIGMNTFGQQFNSMHMNQSLTYIAFGSR